MTNKEKAARYDALMLAIKMSMERCETEASKAPLASEVNDDVLKAAMFGAGVVYQQVAETMKRWLQ